MNNLRKLAAATSIGMFLVLLMGALVTKTDSGRGCGDDWPLCNGRFVPAYTLQSMIEYSHRFVTGIVGLLVVATFIWVWLKIKRNDARWFSLSVLFFTVLQALLGAAAVMWPQSSGVLALHFGFSLLAFVSTYLLLITLWPESEVEQQPKTAVSSGLKAAIWLTLIYCYGVIYLGAFVRHTNSAGGCIGWPLCNGEVIPELSGATGIVFIHRVAALLLLILIGWLAWTAERNSPSPRVRLLGRWSFGFVAMQVVSGAFVTFSIGSDAYLFASLLHTVLICGLFSALCHMAWASIRAGRPAAVDKP